MRTDRVWLANDVSRCEPSKRIAQCEKCARALAEIPPMGSLTDFSLSIPKFCTWCAHYLSQNQKPEPAKRETKVWPT